MKYPQKIANFSRNKPNVLSNLIKHWLAVKTDAKKAKNSVLEKCAKLIVNTIYGLLNMSSSHLYKYEVGSAVTAYCR